MLAVVVDDHDMAHHPDHPRRRPSDQRGAAVADLSTRSAGRIPAMAHIPLIHGPDGAKLSKRHGALGVDAYRAMGYLPEAVRNYLVRLGWSQGDREFFTTPEMITAFNLDGIGRSAARFDFAKLENVNGHYMRAASCEALVDALESALPSIPDAPFKHARCADAGTVAGRDAGPEGAGEDPGRSCSKGPSSCSRRDPLRDGRRRPPPSSRRAMAISPTLLPRFERAERAGPRMSLEDAVRAYVADREGQARERGAAAARGTHGALGVAGGLRRLRGARSRRKPRAACGIRADN